MSAIEVGKPRVFRLLFDTFYPRAYVFACRLLGNDEIAADITQETFLYIWQKTKSFPNTSAFKSYMYSTLKNKCLNYLRDRVQTSELKEEYGLATDQVAIDHLMIEQELKSRVLHEINKLPEMKREIMLMRLEEESFEEIAEKLNLSVNTVKAHKKEAYKRLRIGLSDCGKLAFTGLLVLDFLLK